MPNPSQNITLVAIADRLEEAAHTLRRLPKVTVQGFKSNWPPTVNEFHEAYGYNEAEVRLGPPSARHISEMDEALQWMLLLTVDPEYTRKLVWLRANGVRWKAIQRRFPHSRTKLYTDWRNSIYTMLLGLQRMVNPGTAS
jgi:Domain of unknown function (DUF6362)